jgi:hypothetical protein
MPAKITVKYSNIDSMRILMQQVEDDWRKETNCSEDTQDEVIKQWREDKLRLIVFTR